MDTANLLTTYFDKFPTNLQECINVWGDHLGNHIARESTTIIGDMIYPKLYKLDLSNKRRLGEYIFGDTSNSEEIELFLSGVNQFERSINFERFKSMHNSALSDHIITEMWETYKYEWNLNIICFNKRSLLVDFYKLVEYINESIKVVQKFSTKK